MNHKKELLWSLRVLLNFRVLGSLGLGPGHVPAGSTGKRALKQGLKRNP